MLTLKSSHCPDGKIADVLALTHACTTANASVNYSLYVPQRPRKFPSPQWEFLTDMQFDSRRSIGINSCFTRDMCVLMLKISHRPHGRLMFCSFLQGGGVYVYSGTVTMTSCSITGNTASGSVRAHVQNFPWPDGKIADKLVLTHACTTANASINYSRYVPQRPSKVPIAWKTADVLASTHACTTANASVNYSMYVLQRPLKVPIAPMGK